MYMEHLARTEIDDAWGKRNFTIIIQFAGLEQPLAGSTKFTAGHPLPNGKWEDF